MNPIISSQFIDPANLNRALVHRSYCNEHSKLESNERLEFLGDSVLSVIISERLYILLPNVAEGELTSRRSYLVQTKALAQKSSDLGLDKMLLLSRGEEDSGGRQNPGLLANTFEAVLGSLYLEQGLGKCQDYLLQVFPDSDLLNITQSKDPKSLLQETAQARGWGTPVYKTVNSEGPDHAKTFTMSVALNNQEMGVGQGNSKQRAETEAAVAALASDMLK